MNELDETLELLHRDARNAPPRLAGARARLMAEIDAEPDATVVPLRRRRRFVLPVAAAAAGVLVLSAVAVRLGSDDQAPATGQAGGTSEPKIARLSAVEVLNRAADVSVGAVDQPLKPGQFRYIVEHTWVQRTQEQGTPGGAPGTAQGYTYLWEQQIQRWIPADETDTWQETRKILDTSKFLGGTAPQAQDPVLPVTTTDQGQWQGRCGNFFPKAKPPKKCGDSSDWESPAFYAQLPRDPDQLYAFLADLTKGRGSTPSVMFHYGIEILRSGLMPAELRAQWYRALAKIPGIKVLDAQANLDGRVGVALGLDDQHELRQLIIDPATGQFIGERSIAGPQPDSPWIKPGTELGSSAITTAVADRLGEVPVR